ncbi:MAG: ISAs1 family transposase [Thioploca sp.]|nr:ISAs1 family transposase [Thioploca sp.]
MVVLNVIKGGLLRISSWLIKGVIRTREIDNNITSETAYYLLSYPDDIKRFSQSARGHWGIENSQHCSLDVSFNEDQSRIRKGLAGENLAVIVTWRLICSS